MVMIGCISTWCDLGYIGSDEVDFSYRILQWKLISTYRELWKFDTTDKRDFIVAELSLIWNTFSFFSISAIPTTIVEYIMEFCGIWRNIRRKVIQNWFLTKLGMIWYGRYNKYGVSAIIFLFYWFVLFMAGDGVFCNCTQHQDCCTS